MGNLGASFTWDGRRLDLHGGFTSPGGDSLRIVGQMPLELTLAAATGAPVRAADPTCCIGGDPLRDGETVFAAGLEIGVLATPGHTADSVCFLLPSDAPDRPHGSVLTGDTILGRGTTVIAPPDGSLRDYLGSLRVLAALGHAYVLPAHGPQRLDLEAVAAEYLAHREQRLDQIRDALVHLGSQAGVAEYLRAPGGG